MGPRFALSPETAKTKNKIEKEIIWNNSFQDTGHQETKANVWDPQGVGNKKVSFMDVPAYCLVRASKPQHK